MEFPTLESMMKDLASNTKIHFTAYESASLSLIEALKRDGREINFEMYKAAYKIWNSKIHNVGFSVSNRLLANYPRVS